MSGAHQGVFMNQRSFAEPTPTVIGQAFGGGFWAGDISTTANSVATHHLVIGPLSTAQSTLQWKTTGTATTIADSNIDGPQNTASMVADGNSTVYPSAHFCNNLTIGGFSDFYMPAQNELEVCYANLKPTTTSNNTFSPGGGSNPNSVPARTSFYTTFNPARTSAAAFQSGGAEAFSAELYWASTLGTSGQGARVTNFSLGSQANGLPSFSYPVRAVRRVAV